MESVLQMLSAVGVRTTLQQFEPGGDISQWRQGKAGDWDVLGNGFPSPTGLALTIMQGMYAGTAEKEATRDTYHGTSFPRSPRPSPRPPRRRRHPARRTSRGCATPDLGHVPVSVVVRPESGPRAPLADRRCRVAAHEFLRPECRGAACLDVTRPPPSTTRPPPSTHWRRR